MSNESLTNETYVTAGLAVLDQNRLVVPQGPSQHGCGHVARTAKAMGPGSPRARSGGVGPDSNSLSAYPRGAGSPASTSAVQLKICFCVYDKDGLYYGKL